MDILTYIKTKLEDCNISEIETIAASSNIPYQTIIKIKYGTTSNPRIKTIQPLLNYFKKVV